MNSLQSKAHRPPKSLYFNKPMAIRLQNGRVSLPKKSILKRVPSTSIYTKYQASGAFNEPKLKPELSWAEAELNRSWTNNKLPTHPIKPRPKTNRLPSLCVSFLPREFLEGRWRVGNVILIIIRWPHFIKPKSHNLSEWGVHFSTSASI